MGYSNSPLVTVTILSPNNSGERKHSIDRITPHVMEGQLTAAQCGQYFSDSAVRVSSNYGIGCDGSLGLYVPEGCRSWCSSSAENDDRAVTIECASDTAAPYALRYPAWKMLIALCLDICNRYGKKKLLWIPDKAEALAYQPAEDEMLLTIHRWFSDTTCPGAWLLERLPDLAEAVTLLLGTEPEQTSEPATADSEPLPASPQGNAPAFDDESPAAIYGTQAADLKGLGNGAVIRKVAKMFQVEQRRSGILASVSLAQFLLESAYGQSDVFQHSNNGFGMKTWISGNSWPGTVWDGESKYTTSTQEQKEDDSLVYITASFRAYPCLEDSIADHSAYLLNARDETGGLRYLGLAGCRNYRQAFGILKAGGYATGVDYVDWLVKIVRMWHLTQFDLDPEPQPAETPETPENLTPDAGQNEDTDNLLPHAKRLSEALKRAEFAMAKMAAATMDLGVAFDELGYLVSCWKRYLDAAHGIQEDEWNVDEDN